MTQAPARERREVAVHGIVQGVGFRPFVYALALRHGLAGSVRNDAEGVFIDVEGDPASPDTATCEACLRELFDPADRRYRYPFTNCTNCGPRFTITRSVPYDRAMTTMSGFTMCPACRREYDDPLDRRFHAQPNACPLCGPRVTLCNHSGRELPTPGIAGFQPASAHEAEDAIARTAQLLRGGAIVAIKGLGGYHLACDPFNAQAVGALRGRKVRQDKPFALMARDLAQVRELCRLGPEEEALLSAPWRPIVLLERREDARIAADVAPRQHTLGVMLAYTPLHHLLLHDAGIPLVMTSGNRSDEPIAYRDEDAFERLGAIADNFLIHNRPIHMRCDDSVTRVVAQETYPIRRSRGYAPAPLTVAQSFDRHVLACGGELKNTFCLAKERHAFISHHIGDLENYETLRSFREGVEHFGKLFDVQPEVVAYDLHPEYLSTRYARELEEAGLLAVGVQHHHAHIASCLADNERPAEERVIGVALDGTGYGTDGTIWGGEFLVGSIREGFARRAHLEYAPLPGGEAAIRQPWRMALAQLITLYGEEQAVNLPLAVVRWAGERNVRLIARLLEHGLNTPSTSSAGRLFDAVAALVGAPGTHQSTYEGQAAVELELAATPDRQFPQESGGRTAADGPVQQAYPFLLRQEGEIPINGRLVAQAEDAEGRVVARTGGAQRPAAAQGRQAHGAEGSFVTRTGGAEGVALRDPLSSRGDEQRSCSSPPQTPTPIEGEAWVIETRGIIAGVVEDVLTGRPAGETSARFHRTMADLVVATCLQLSQATGLRAVALSGGTFQNVLLLTSAMELLAGHGFVVYRHRRVPANDGGLSLGQAVLAAQ